MSIIKAQQLEDIYKAFQPEPLATASELAGFYVPDFSATRGGNKIDHLALGLNRQFSRGNYKAFVMGHPGVGSTGHLATALLAQALGVEVTHIPYRGAAPMLQEAAATPPDSMPVTPEPPPEQAAQ